MTNGFESRGKHSIIVWYGKERVASDIECILIAYEHIRQTIEHVLHEKGNLPCFDEWIPFLFFSVDIFHWAGVLIS